MLNSTATMPTRASNAAPAAQNGPFERRRFPSRDEFIRFVARRREQINKEDLIVNLCAGREVLDLGCVDHSAKRFLELGEKCLHTRLKQVSHKLVGVDILEEDAGILNALGYDIRCGDVESFDLRARFDVIVAADLIEHLMNIGRFFESVAAHMRQDGLFVISTPNPFNIEQTMRAIFEQKIGVNVEHTCWLDPVVLYQLVSRSPFEIVDFHWVHTRFKMKCLVRPFKYMVNPLAELLMRVRPLCRRDFVAILRLRTPAPDKAV